MSAFANFITGMKVLEEVDSKINGKIKVVRTLGMGTYFQVDGLTQSGGIITDIWKPVLKKVHSAKRIVHRVLILGLGGGTVVKLIHKYWPEAEITGVDIDPAMVEMGKKYLGLDISKVKVVIADASAYCLMPNAYDLIVVDLYLGREFPAKFASDKFLESIKQGLSEKGLAVFNRLYFGEKRPEAVRFGNKLKKFFNKVDFVYPQANLMFLCQTVRI